MGLITMATPLSGVVFVRGLGLPMIDVFAKFEVHIHTGHEDMKGDTKCRKCCIFGSYGPIRSLEKNHSTKRIQILISLP